MIEEVPMLISRVLVTATLLAFTSLSEVAHAQLIDRTLAPNAAGEGIAKSLVDQAGVGRGSDTTPGSSIFIIDRDPFRAIRRGRQLFQRQFTRNQGQGPVTGDGAGLRVRPFFVHGGTISIREFVVRALNNEMGLRAVDPDLAAASSGRTVTTPSGMVLDGKSDTIEAPPSGTNEIPTSVVDFLEFYLLNYFKAGTGEQTPVTSDGRRIFMDIGCARCHKPDLQINRDRRVADVETTFDPVRGIFNRLFATATPLFTAVNDRPEFPSLKRPALKPFLVKNIFTDLKRHDLGPNFYERNYDGTMRTQFLTTPLWGLGSTGPYGHDGRSINLTEVILRHGGDAQDERDKFARLEDPYQGAVLDFLNTLILFPPA